MRSRRVAWNNARTVFGWALFGLFVAMVVTWTVFGFAPGLAEHAPQPFAAFGSEDGFWEIFAGFVAGGGAAWALAPGLRVEGEETSGGEGGVGLSPIAAALLGPASLVMMFGAYWPCSGDEDRFWGALRHALEAFEGYVAEPFGAVKGCPAEFPQTLLAGVLFGKTTLALVLIIGVAFVFRRSIDSLRARWARQVVVFAGVSDQTVALAREIGRSTTERQTMLILDDGPRLARARELAREISRTRHKAIALPIDVADGEAVESFMRKRGKKGIHGLYLLLPDGSANLKAMDAFLELHGRATATSRVGTSHEEDAEERERAKLERTALLRSPRPADRRLARHLPDDPASPRRPAPLWWRSLVTRFHPFPSEVPGRAVLRIDNPWHAEDWRRRQMLARKGWLFDAISTHSTAARHAVHRMKFPKGGSAAVRRVVVQGTSSFELAVLSELAFERAVDATLESAAQTGERNARRTLADPDVSAEATAAARANLASIAHWRTGLPPTPRVVLLGDRAAAAGEHFRQLLARYGVAMEESDAFDGLGTETLASLMADGETALVVGEDCEDDPTLLAVPHPRWQIVAWSELVQGVSEQPLIGGLSLVGPTLEPVRPDQVGDRTADVPRVDDASAAYGVDVWERLGRIEHKCYLLKNFGGQARRDDRRPARGDWDDDLSETLREDNIRPFATVVRTIAALGYDWASDAGDSGERGTQTAVDLAANADDWARAAISEHSSWVRHRVEDGWAFGERDDVRRVHDNIVGWDQLSEEIQGYDREGVTSALALFRALGFVLARAKS